MKYLNLSMQDGKKLLLDKDVFVVIQEELEEFLVDEVDINTLNFVKKILFNLEIKSNNTVEGINDDIFFIDEVVKNTSYIKDDEKRKRVINLYNGYNYILKNKNIDKEHLRELYAILCDGLLEEKDLDRMGNYYRNAPVYILNKGRLDDTLDEGISVSMIDKYMNEYFDFVNSNSSNNPTDNFVVSQIMHFYFVFIHPYFDVNGRTSRTLAMWYLLNQKAYPYILFNRAINFSNSNYDETIAKAKNYCDVSYFIKYMMENTKKELEKEIIMREIKDNTHDKMTSQDFQTLNYILSMNGDINVLTFTSMYRDKNGHKKIKEIYEEILRPLIDKDILLVERTTNKKMYGNYSNEMLTINSSKYDKGNPKIRRLDLSNK